MTGVPEQRAAHADEHRQIPNSHARRCTMTSRFLLILMALLVSSLPAPAQPETSKLRISAVPIAGFTPIYAADKLGCFKQAGLEVTIDRAAGGAQTVPLLVQGTLQLAVQS